MNNIVELKKLTKQYGGVSVVDQVSFTIEKNKIYGLLGRNGAGKTTMMKIMAGQILASEGDIKVFDEDPFENNRVLSQLCFIKESQKYPDQFRVLDVLESVAQFFPNWDRDYAFSLIEDFRLPIKQKVKKLSRGMLSSVGIIVGLASRAPLTVFDEPYLGLDAVARTLFYNLLIDDYSKHPRTIILSTHLIDEVSRILEHCIVINEGKLLIDEETDILRDSAFHLVGSKDSVEMFTKEKEIISRESIGSLLSVTFMGRLDTTERTDAQSLGLELVPVSIQQLFVYLTTEKVGVNG